MNMKPKQLAHISWAAVFLIPAVLHGQVREVRITSSIDGSEQRAIFFAPEKKDAPVPLLVTLHSWSADYRQKLHKSMEDHCVKNGWAYVHPNFRGPNRNPKATGSDLAVQDVLDAVAYAKKQTKVDEKRILLVGTSGGGYMSLLMAGRSPKLWAGVSAWVPISDLAAWHAECKAKGRKYAREIELSCEGVPKASDTVDEQYHKRSPLTYLPKAKGIVNLDINAGIRDGHSGSVPVSHSLHAFNAVAEEKDQVPQALIDELVQTAKAPDSHAFSGKDLSYGKKQPLFRRASSKARVTLFNGGHELVASAALAWLIKSSK
jgi:pimeloyl-ACP methyl ester carboxylesterase